MSGCEKSITTSVHCSDDSNLPPWGKMSNHLSQTQCLAPPQQLPSFGTVPSLSFQPQCFAPTMSTILPPGPTYQSLNNTSPSSDSLFSVSTSLNSLPSECPPRRSDLDLKMETPDADELDDFFDLEKHQKARSASFGGSTQYSSQLAIARNGLFAPSLDTIGSVASGGNVVLTVFRLKSTINRTSA
ncbi:hypothetical protein RB195_004408 [Necator americanus]|uniref:Uncharacterized protein n=1 Tax=Necator americanus TaxID=51031 RepID=A0ABR1BJY3_NECAM